MKRSVYLKAIVVFMVIASFTLITVFTSIASPSLNDAYITYSLKVYYSQYLLSVSKSWTFGYYYSSSGSWSSASGWRIGSHYYPVLGGGTLFTIRSGNPTSVIYNIIFYDSSQAVISDGYYYSSSEPINFISVPAGASYCRVASASSNIQLADFYCVPGAASSSNYQYIWTEIDDVTISNDIVQIPYTSGLDYSQIFLDFQFDTTETYYSMSLDVYSYFVGFGSTDNTYPSGTYCSLYYYFINSDSEKDFNFLDDSINNPASFVENVSDGFRFDGFRLYIPIMENVGSGFNNLFIELSNFFLGDEEAVIISDIDSELGRIDDTLATIIPSLTVPSVAPDFVSDLTDDYYGHLLNNDFNLIIGSIYWIDFIPTLIIISLGISILGFILFGRRG